MCEVEREGGTHREENSTCISLQGLPLRFACKLLMQLLSAGICLAEGRENGTGGG